MRYGKTSTQVIIAIVTIIICLILTKVIWESDMPIWLKWFLTK